MTNTYDIFSGEDLKVAELIQQRRYQMLIHSCLYYHLNTNIISDKQFDEWGRELVRLQHNYPEISKQVTLYEEFKDWDASTGAFLPITTPWVVAKAKQILNMNIRPIVANKQTKSPSPLFATPKKIEAPTVKRRKLF